MKVFIQIIDIRTAIYQTGMIEEPVVKGKEVVNALAHFGVRYGDINWKNNNFGEIEGTSKVVSVVTIE